MVAEYGIIQSPDFREELLADDFQELIRQVKEANDIADVVGGYVALRPAGPTFKGLCPFHDDNRPSFDVDPRRQRYRCWACGKHGDVISFVQEQDRVDFREALELLARRAGISLEKNAKFQPNPGRALMLEVVKRAEQLFHECLLDDPSAEAARTYLSERRLNGETIRNFGLGYAPAEGSWLLGKAKAEHLSLETLEQVGLISKRREGAGYFDRFRDRVMFPIRDGQGRPMGFGGRVLPNSPFAARGPKYYNSAETPLFNKSELLYGLDRARETAAKESLLAVVEGYTDVLMAHQHGVANVVATMGTALNSRHVRHLRRHVSRVVLVFDADAGGESAVDRALEVFAGENIAVQVAALPEGRDPCDLLLERGADGFREVLATAQDVLDFKLNQVCEAPETAGLEGQRRAVDDVLRIIAKGAGRYGDQLKQELMMTRIAQRFGIKEESLWQRLRKFHRELDEKKQPAPTSAEEQPIYAGSEDEEDEHGPLPVQRTAPAKAHERDLLALLFADPSLVGQVEPRVSLDEMQHPGLRMLLEGLYRLRTEGVEPTLDQLRTRIDNPALIAKAFELQERGGTTDDRRRWLDDVLHCFHRLRDAQHKHDLKQQMHALDDVGAAEELLRQLQNRS